MRLFEDLQKYDENDVRDYYEGKEDNVDGLTFSLDYVLEGFNNIKKIKPNMEKKDDYIIVSFAMDNYDVDVDNRVVKRVKEDDVSLIARSDIYSEDLYKERGSIDLEDWCDLLGYEVVAEEKGYAGIGRIVEEMVFYGNTVEDVKAKQEEIIKELDKRIADLESGKEKTYSFDELIEELNEGLDEDIKVSWREIDNVYDELEKDIQKVMKECYQNNISHFHQLLDSYKESLNREE